MTCCSDTCVSTGSESGWSFKPWTRFQYDHLLAVVDEDPPRALGDQALSLAVERVLEGKRDEAWRAFDAASREIDRQKDALLDEISQRLEQKLDEEPLFTVRWRLT